MITSVFITPYLTGIHITPAFQQWVEAVEIAGPGFLNLRLKPDAKQQTVREILAAGKAYGVLPASGQKLMVEFVSANPTGPLHVGHGRQAALGDAICNLLATQGWSVTREFYYNDGGRANCNPGRFGAGTRQRPEAR